MKYSRSWKTIIRGVRENWNSSRLPSPMRRPSTLLRKQDRPIKVARSCDYRISEKLSNAQHQSSDPHEVPLASKGTKEQADKISSWDRLIEEYRKNYCPRRSPPLVLPTDTEKYSYVDMNRPFLIGCSLIAFLTLAVGAWMFARTSYIFSWYALYVFFSEFCLFASLFISILGRKFDVSAHERLLTNFLYPKTTRLPLTSTYLSVRSPLKYLRIPGDTSLHFNTLPAQYQCTCLMTAPTPLSIHCPNASTSITSVALIDRS